MVDKIVPDPFQKIEQSEVLYSLFLLQAQFEDYQNILTLGSHSLRLLHMKLFKKEKEVYN